LAAAAQINPTPCETFFAHAFALRLLLRVFLARFQVKGVTLDLLDDVFLLHFAFEATKGTLQRLALL
jgi:hypothetical protein